MTNDSLLGVVTCPTIYKDLKADALTRAEFDKEQDKKHEEALAAAAKAPAGKKDKNAPVAVLTNDEIEKEVMLEDKQENDILLPKQFSDEKSKLRSISDII